jgi:peptide subunit release factor RF-3
MADRLVEMLTELGVPDPKGWASSQTEEGIDQLSRASILVELAAIVREAAASAADEKNPPSERVAAALAAVKASGISDEAFRTALEFGCALTAFGVCALLDGATEIANNPGEREIALALKTPGHDFTVTDLGLHESWGQVLNTTLGREVYWS